LGTEFGDWVITGSLVVLWGTMGEIVATLALGLQPRQKGLQGCGPRRSQGDTSHTPESVRKCEGVNPHTPKATPTLGDGVPMESQNSESDFRGQNSMACGIIYIIGKLLECKYLKWARIVHLDI
jgi:hypothetical protein